MEDGAYHMRILYLQKDTPSVSFVYMIGEVRRQQYICVLHRQRGRIAILMLFYILLWRAAESSDMWRISFIISQ